MNSREEDYIYPKVNKALNQDFINQGWIEYLKKILED